jgi:hypothetical protein
MNLGKLERIDLRQIWETEAGDFTPWLAKESNIKLLGDTIGLELEVEAQEKEVGPFRADILCLDTVTGSWVLIENQIEKTNHTHLGQILTYAAGLNAVTIVWIAEIFTDEHRAALDWLNEMTDSSVNFFGLEIELWKIGDSAVAPKFNFASKPNDWSKTVKSQKTSDSFTKTEQTRLEYWSRYCEYMQSHSDTIKPRKPTHMPWNSTAIGRSHFHLSAVILIEEKKIDVRLVLGGEKAKPHYYLLLKNKTQIEQEFEETIEWMEKPNSIRSILQVSKSADPSNIADRETQFKWCHEKLEKFYRVFEPRIRGLDASEYTMDEES